MMKTPSLVGKSMVVVVNKSPSLRMCQGGKFSPPRREILNPLEQLKNILKKKFSSRGLKIGKNKLGLSL